MPSHQDEREVASWEPALHWGRGLVAPLEMIASVLEYPMPLKDLEAWQESRDVPRLL